MKTLLKIQIIRFPKTYKVCATVKVNDLPDFIINTYIEPCNPELSDQELTLFADKAILELTSGLFEMGITPEQVNQTYESMQVV